MKKTLVPLLLAGAFSLGALSCQGNTVGLGCTVDKDCDRGQSCFLTDFPGGFCTRGCVQEGSTLECPMGTVCTRTTAASPTLFCSSTCTDDGQCRGGQYACRSITGSMQKACAP
jgi:hypothetical protein